jgi:hypothetical protein
VQWKQLTPGVIELCGEPNFTPWNARVLDSATDFCFISIRKGSVNVAVTFAKGNLYGLFNLVGAGLPCSKTNCWDPVASVQSECLSVTKVTLVDRLSFLMHEKVFKD